MESPRVAILVPDTVTSQKVCCAKGLNRQASSDRSRTYAHGHSNMFAPLPFQETHSRGAGTNVIPIYAVDAAGLTSATSAVPVTYISPR